MNTPRTASALQEAIPQAVSSCSAWLQDQLNPLMRKYGAIDAIALFSKATIGDPYSFPVIATDDGVVCGSRTTTAMQRQQTDIWLGFAHVSGDSRAYEVVDLHPFSGWGEHAELIAEMMRTARVAI